MCKKMIILLSLILVFALAGSASAASLTWNGDGDGSSWDDLDNWDGDAVPTSSDTAIMNSGASVTIDSTMTAVASSTLVGDASASATLSVTGGSFGLAGNLIMGDDANGTGTVTVSGGTVDAGGEIIVANNGTGTLTVSGGDVDSVSHIKVGHASGSDGTMTASGGTVDTGGWLMVGNNGDGEMTVSGGDVNAVGHIQIGVASTGDGTVTVNSGELSSDGSLIVGSAGTGSLDVNGGEIVVENNLDIGSKSGSDGDVTLDGGTITAGGFKMSDSSTQSAMDITDGILYLEGDDRADVETAIDDSVLTTSNTGCTVAYEYYAANDETKVYSLPTTGSTITFDNGGSASLWSAQDNWNGDVLPSKNDNVQINGSYTVTVDSTMSGSRGADGKRIYVGYANGSSATLTITGGRVTANQDHMYASFESGSTGTINLSGGEIIADNFILIGRSGTGTFNVSGGTVYADDHIFAAHQAAGTGTINVTGGEIYTAGNFFVGHYGDGTLNVSHGLIETAKDLIIGNKSGSTGDVSLDGGVFKADGLVMNDSRSLMDITDGLLILEGNDTTTVNGYISNGNITLTANGGSGTLAVTYDSNTDKTYVYDNGTGLTQTWDGSSSNDFAVKENWNNNRTPMALDTAKIDTTSGVVTIDADVECDDLQGPGYTASTTGTLNITDGDITVYDEVWFARFGTGTVNMYYPATLTIKDRFAIAPADTADGTLNMYGGTIDATDNTSNFFCGWKGTAEINMYGGSISVDTLNAPAHAEGTANINIHGGVLSCSSISVLSGSNIDIADSGRLIINGDKRTTINTYLSDNRITIDGDNTDSLATVDYDNLNAGKTTVQVKDVDILDYFLQTEDTNDEWTLYDWDVLSDTDPDGQGATTYIWSKNSNSEVYSVWKVHSNTISQRYEVIENLEIRRFEPSAGSSTGEGMLRFNKSMSPGGAGIITEYDIDDANYDDANSTYVTDTSGSGEDREIYMAVSWAEVTYDKGSNTGFGVADASSGYAATDVLRRRSEWQSSGLTIEDYDYKKGYGPVNWLWIENIERKTKNNPHETLSNVYYCGNSTKVMRYCYIEPNVSPPEVYDYDVVLQEKGRQLEVFEWESYWSDKNGNPDWGTEWYVVTRDLSKEQYFEKKFETVPATTDYNLDKSDDHDTIYDLPHIYTTDPN